MYFELAMLLISSDLQIPLSYRASTRLGETHNQAAKNTSSFSQFLESRRVAP